MEDTQSQSKSEGTPIQNDSEEGEGGHILEVPPSENGSMSGSCKNTDSQDVDFIEKKNEV